MATTETLTDTQKEQQAAADDAKQHAQQDDRIDFLVDPERFATPTMGDFYLGAVDGVYLKMIDKLANTKEEGKENDRDAAFYTEEPPIKESSHEEGIYALKAHVSISDDDIDQGFADGRTLNINIADVSGENKAVADLKKQLTETMNNYGSLADNAEGNTYFTLRLIGLGCPATPKWAFEYDYKNSMLNQKTVKVGEAAESSQYVFVSGLHDEEEELNFVKIAGKWREVTFYDQGEETSSFRWLMDPGDEANEKARQAAKNLQALLDKNGNEIYFLADDKAISRDSSMSAAEMGSAASDASIMGELSYSVKNAPAGCAYKTGYARTHQEAYRRFSGTAYVKVDGKYCNLAKLALTDSTNEELYPDASYDGGHSTLFQPKRYDKEKQNFADAYFEVLSALDDRRKIQKELFNQEWTDLHKWTVTIGDVTCFVPPTNITCISAVQNESQPMIRTKGSATKGGHRVTRRLQLELYFNEDRGINGFKKDIKLPNDATLTYKLNGLRQMVAQFKFTPFLPIENDYINDTLGIEAVLFESMQIGHVANYPKLYQVQLTLAEFDYAAYMPELITFAMESGYEGNIFSSSINWAVMRYYYQRCIRKGDMVAASGYKFNTDEYNSLLTGNRTTLIPMAFNSNEIKFYLANREYLDQMVAARMEMLNGSGKSAIDFGKDELSAMKKLGVLSKAIKEAAGSEDFLAALKRANENSQGDINLLMIGDPNNTYRYFAGRIEKGDSSSSANSYYGTGVTYGIGNKIDKDKNFDYYINAPVSVIQNYVDAVNETLGDQGYLVGDTKLSFDTKDTEDGKDVYIGISVGIGTDYLSKDDNFQDLKQDASNYIGVDKGEFFKDYRINIPLKAHFTRDSNAFYHNTTGFELDKDSPDMKFLEFCEQADDLEKEAKDVKKRKSGTDLNALDSIVYDEYKIGTAYIQDFNAVLSNHVSAVFVNNISGTSSQYLGGEDTSFTFVIRTTSREAAAKLSALPKIAAKYARDYHAILPYYPLRVDSEFTGFLGVNEVVIESAQVDTSNDATGVYTVQLAMRSVDRTLRDRESMQRAELHNDGYNRGEARVKNHIKTFFEIQDILNKAELYPDLELPTLKEMEKVGYEFVRYKFQDGRQYVDPDFYFVYPQVLMSQVIRELVINGVNAGLGDRKLTDKTGAQINITPAEKKGFTVSDGNDLYTDQKEIIKKTSSVSESQQRKVSKENLREGDLLVLRGEREQWAVCDDITPMFLEQNYRKEYEAFEAHCSNQGLSMEDGIAKAEEEQAKEEAAKETEGEGAPAETADKKDPAEKKANDTSTDAAENKQGDNTSSNSAQDSLSTSQQSSTDSQEEKKDDQSSSDAENKSGEEKKAADPTSDIQAQKNAKELAQEGQWVATKMQDARDASSLIMQYLTQKPINKDAAKSTKEKQQQKEDAKSFTNSDGQSTPKNQSTGMTSGGLNQDKDKDMDSTEVELKSVINKFLDDGDIQEIFSKLDIDYSNEQFKDVFKDIVYAAACASTGEKEYAGKKSQKDWRPDKTYIATINHNEGQDITGNDLATSIDEGVEKGIRFGIYNIRMYTRSELLRLTNEDVEDKNGETINEKLYLLDPYYRIDPERIEEYKRNCINSNEYCTWAFLRIMLYWMSRLIDEKAIPTITNDVLRGAVKNEINIQYKQAEAGAADYSKTTQTLNDNITFFNKRTYAIDSGKIFSSTIMALTDGNGMLLGYIKKNNYRALNAYIQSCSSPKTLVKPTETNIMPTRKLVLALVGTGRITDMSAIGSSPVTPATKYYQQMMERKYIAAAEDPKQFIPHSCHDMVVADARGRMLRAFPTFYMVFVDEGREIGQWRLHDNFYTTSALLDMQIVKSRKIAADTATITMSNFYQSYTTETDDYQKQIGIEKSSQGGDGFFETILDDNIVSSIFNPNEYAQKVEAQRRATPKQTRIRLREGARMHIRLGYGASANMLPIVFNGIVTEVSAEDTVELIAQGDGIELLNPITDLEEAHEANPGWSFKDFDIFRNAATTKEIMTWILTRKGGWMSDLASGTKLEGIINCNPYGLYHFGSPDLKQIHKSGEICQNIFDSWDTPIWGDLQQADNDTPRINIQMFQKTVWDVANICKSVKPDYICGVAPFSFRSTLFIGDPRYYYAYDYDQSSGGSMVEKRKPYQQYHIYTSYSDIIGNGMRASSRKMKTNAIGLYSVDLGTGSSQQKTDPIMADIDIYPEYQKTMIVDTRLFAKGVPIISGVEAYAADLFDRTTKIGDEKGHIVNNEKIARSMALSALIDSMRDMYCGDIIVLGDASVKPHDRIYINDTYEGFKGQATVKEVVHSFNVNDGFTTAISPDCIVKADGRFESVVNGAFNSMATAATAIAAVGVYNAGAMMMKNAPSISGFYKNLMDTDLAKKAAGKIGNLKDKAKDLIGKYTPDKIKGSSAAKLAGKALSKGKAIKNGITAARFALSSTGWGLVLVATEMAISYVVTSAVSSIVEEKLKNMNAVKVYPVERFCIPYTAGIAGSKGLVISEHSKPDGTGIKASLAKLLTDGPVMSVLSDLMLSDEAKAAVEKMKRDVGIIDSSGNPTTTMTRFGQKYMTTVGNTMDESDYRSMMITPRVDLGKAWDYANTDASSLDEEKTAERDTLASDIKASYDKYAMLDTERWFTDPKLKNNVNISDDDRLKPYMDEQFFYIIHEQPTLNKQEKRVETQVITTTSGDEDYVKTIVENTANGPVYDVAMLNPDAMNVLYEIVRRAKNRMPAAKASDQVEAYEKTKGSYIVLKSALRIGDKTSYAPTGFSFILQGTGDAYEPIIKAAEELTQETKEDHDSSDGFTNETIFSYTYGADQGIENNEVLFTVYMPKATVENTGDDTSGE